MAEPVFKKQRMDGSLLPPGWLECPEMGQPIGLFVPMKAPMDERHDGEVPPERRFTPALACSRASKLVWHNPAQNNAKVPFSGVGLVIDLSKARSFYNPVAFKKLGVECIKIPCLGREGAPDTEAVNRFCYTASQVYATMVERNQCILVHCTHGYNRTGFMIVSYWLRYHLTVPYMSVALWIDQFRRARPPGIYKQEYVAELVRRSNEVVPNIKAAPLPDWKPEDEEDEMGTEGAAHPSAEHGDGAAEQEPEHPRHDDIFSIGERISDEEVHQLRIELTARILGPHRASGSSDDFPGSHPVSLERRNMHLLREKEYMVTWKADGTRYLLLINDANVYLIDRKFDMARVPVRFLQYVPSHLRPKFFNLKFGPYQPFTVLDGEMVVDEDVISGTVRRRYLIYDVLFLNGEDLLKVPFKERYERIDREVIGPRTEERMMCDRGKLKYRYDYNLEPFSVRKKGFYPIQESRKLIEKLIPELSHESDGLIFQGAQDVYVPGTFDDLLKWKFTHMNSVDLLLRIKENGKVELCAIDRAGLVPVDFEIHFPNGEDPEYFNNKIVECTWDKPGERFAFMRERIDKTAPNGKRVFDRVMQSIKDDIHEEFLLGYLEDKEEEGQGQGKEVLGEDPIEG